MASTEGSPLTQALNFLRTLTRKAPTEAHLAITARTRTTAPRSYFYPCGSAGVAAAAAQALRLSASGYDVYVRCSLLKKESKGQGRGKRHDTLGSSVLWVDIDRQDALEELLSFQLPPTFINSSGNGLHCFWVLEDFSTDIGAIEDCNRFLCAQFRADHCHDATHLLRIPGTRNYKDREKPKEVRLVWSSSQTYRIEEFPRNPAAPREAHSNFITKELPADFLQELPAELRRRILEPQKDRSDNDWFVVKRLLELGYDTDTCLSVLCSPWPVGDKTRERGYGYAVTTVQNAAAKKSVLLDPVLDSCLFFTDEKGGRHKRPLLMGSALVDPVAGYLRSLGYNFYVHRDSSTGFIVTPDGQTLVADTSDQAYRDWLSQISGFTEEEKEHKILRSGLASAVRLGGTPVEICPWSCLDLASNSARILIEDCILEVPAGGLPRKCLNGTGGKLLNPSQLTDAEIVFEPTANASGLIELIELFTKVLAMDPIGQIAFTCTALALPITKGAQVHLLPLFHITGPSGGGKSQTLGLLSTWLHGSPKLINSTQAALYRSASREILLPFDDYDALPSELQQFILTAATGITRQRSGSGPAEVIDQQVHVPMALTSVTEIETETVRRRTLVFEVNKKVFPSANYTPEHWRRLAARRSWLWSCYIHWLAEYLLPRLSKEDLVELALRVEHLIPLDIFSGLAPFLALTGLVYEELERCLHCFSLGSFEDAILKFIGYLKLADVSEISERKELLAAIQMAFEGYDSLISREDPEYFRSLGFRLTPCDQRLGIGLEGTTTEWMVTLTAVSRGLFEVKSEKTLGLLFNRLLGQTLEIPSGQKESVPVDVFGYRFVRLRNAGLRKNNHGWRVIALK